MMAGVSTVDPVALSKVIQSLRAKPGDIFHLMTDTYTLPLFQITLDGTNVAPITFKPLTGNTPIVDGPISIDGDYLIIRDLEIMYSSWTNRVSQEAGSSPTDIPLGLDGNGLKVKFINNVIHDFSRVGVWSASQDAEWYGNVVYNIGWQGPDRDHGHMLYIQNNAGARKLVKHNIMIGSFGWGIHAYAKNGAQICDMDFVENIIACAGNLGRDVKPNILIGPENESASGINLTGNKTYGGAGLNFYVGGAVDVTLVNNYIPDGVTGPYTAVVESGNYWGPAVGNQVFVTANEYDNTRAHVAIYNQAEAESVEVDVSAIYTNGTVLQVHNAQDYFNDIQTLTVSGGKITVSMINRTVAAPQGWEAPATTFPVFGAFVVEAE